MQILVICQYQNTKNITTLVQLYTICTNRHQQLSCQLGFYPTSHTFHTWQCERVRTALVMMGALCHNSVLLPCFADSQKVVLPLLPPAFASLPLELFKKKRRRRFTAYNYTPKKFKTMLKRLVLPWGRLTYWLVDHLTSVPRLKCHLLDPSADVCLAWKIHL